MTPEECFQKIEENLLATTEMQRTSDRRWERRLAEHDARLTRVEEVVKSLAGAEKKLFRALEILHDEQGVTRSMLDALIKNIDRFVRGQGGNGRGGKGGKQQAG